MEVAQLVGVAVFAVVVGSTAYGLLSKGRRVRRDRGAYGGGAHGPAAGDTFGGRSSTDGDGGGWDGGGGGGGGSGGDGGGGG